MLRKEKLPQTADEEQLKVQELRNVIGPLEGRAAKFCTDQCLHRYLRARNWNVKKSEKMLRDTLKWRAHFKPEEIRWEDVAHESETGKLYRTPFFDSSGRSVLVLAPGRQNTNNHDNQIRHLVYCLENAIISLPQGQEQMVWLLDYRGFSILKSPPFRTSLETLNILQNHYPERLGFAILYDAPHTFEAFWSMIRPFMDIKTVKKVKFVSSKAEAGKKWMAEMFDLNTLEKAFGGQSEWEYNHSAYGMVMAQDDLLTAKHWGIEVDYSSKQDGVEDVKKEEDHVATSNGV